MTAVSTESQVDTVEFRELLRSDRPVLLDGGMGTMLQNKGLKPGQFPELAALEHPDWLENLKLATALQQDILTEYPTLMRPILLRNSRYNQHTTAGSLLVEMGAAGNSPEEAALAARLFAQGMGEVLLGK